MNIYFQHQIQGKFHGAVSCIQPAREITIDQSEGVITFGNLALPRDEMPVVIQCNFESVILQTDISQ